MAGGALGAGGAPGGGDAGCQCAPSRPVRVSTVRPGGTAVPGRSTRISASSLTACSASSSRSRAAWSRSDAARGAARGHLRRALAGVATIRGMLPVAASFRPAIAAGQLDLCLGELALFPAQSASAAVTRAPPRPARPRAAPRRRPGCRRTCDLTAAQVGDLVDEFEQFAVVADDHQHAGPGRDGVVEPLRAPGPGCWSARRAAGCPAAAGQRGQRDQDGLAAGEPLHPVVQADAVKTEAVQPGAGALLDVPVVADRREVLLARLARLDGVQRGPGGADAELVDAERRCPGPRPAAGSPPRHGRGPRRSPGATPRRSASAGSTCPSR